MHYVIIHKYLRNTSEKPFRQSSMHTPRAQPLLYYRRLMQGVCCVFFQKTSLCTNFGPLSGPTTLKQQAHACRISQKKSRTCNYSLDTILPAGYIVLMERGVEVITGSALKTVPKGVGGSLLLHVKLSHSKTAILYNSNVVKLRLIRG